MKITKILYSKNLNQGKYQALTEQASLLGKVRSEIWQRFSSISSIDVKDRTIRNQWLKNKRDFKPLLANAWKETLRDSIANINLYREAIKSKVRHAIKRHSQDEIEQKRLYVSLKLNKWTTDNYLTRIMRKYYKKGYNHISKKKFFFASCIYLTN